MEILDGVGRILVSGEICVELVNLGLGGMMGGMRFVLSGDSSPAMELRVTAATGEEVGKMRLSLSELEEMMLML